MLTIKQFLNIVSILAIGLCTSTQIIAMDPSEQQQKRLEQIQREKQLKKAQIAQRLEQSQQQTQHLQQQIQTKQMYSVQPQVTQTKVKLPNMPLRGQTSFHSQQHQQQSIYQSPEVRPDLPQPQQQANQLQSQDRQTQNRLPNIPLRGQTSFHSQQHQQQPIYQSPTIRPNLSQQQSVQSERPLLTSQPQIHHLQSREVQQPNVQQQQSSVQRSGRSQQSRMPKPQTLQKSTRPQSEIAEKSCFICMDEENNNLVSIPCPNGHNELICKECLGQIKNTTNICPMCRTALK